MRRVKEACIYSTIALAGTLTLSVSSASAAPAPGQLLANQCAQCHGTNGSAGFKALAGKRASMLYKQLLSMKSRSTPQGVMDWQARGYTDAQLWQIAEYFSQQVARTKPTPCSPRNKC